MRILLLGSLALFFLSLVNCSEEQAIGPNDTSLTLDALADLGQQDASALDGEAAGGDAAEPQDTEATDTLPNEGLVLDTGNTEDTEADGGSAMDVAGDSEEDATTPMDVAGDVAVPMDAEADSEEDVMTPPFGSAVPISDGTGYASGELHAMDVGVSGEVSIFWRGVSEGGSIDLLLSVSDPWASAFGPPAVVKAGLLDQGVAVGGDMLRWSGKWTFVWRDKSAEGVDVVLIRTTDAADFAGDDTVLAQTAPGESLWRPYLVKGAQETACVIWQRSNDVEMRCSVDGGENWSDIRQVDGSGTNAKVSAAAFNTEGHLVVALQVGGAGATQIQVRRTADLGLNWEDALDVDGSAVSEGTVSQPLGENKQVKPTLILTMTGHLKLAWHHPKAGTDAIAYLTTSDDGLSWSPITELPHVKANVELVTGRGSDLHASGTETKLGYGDTLTMSSLDEGTTWLSASAIPIGPNSLLLSHAMRANLLEGWLTIAWWETVANNLTKQTLKCVTVEGP